MHPQLGMIRGSDKIPWLGMDPRLGMIWGSDEILDSDGPSSRDDLWLRFGYDPGLGCNPRRTTLLFFFFFLQTSSCRLRALSPSIDDLLAERFVEEALSGSARITSILRLTCQKN
jgi:hypothetical protein